MEEIKKENIPISKNMFHKNIGDKYAGYFNKIYYSNIETRDEVMEELVNSAKEDESLNDMQKRAINICYLAYIQATGKNDFSIPIIGFMKTKKPNLYKILNNNNRAKRAIYQLQDFVDTTGFKIDALKAFDYIHNVICLTIESYRTKTMDIAKHHNLVAGFVSIAYTQYSRGLSDDDIAIKWYILSFLKYMEDISNNVYNDKVIADNFSRIVSLIKTFNLITYFALESVGKLDLIGLKEGINVENKILSQKEKISVQKSGKENDRDSTIRRQEFSMVDDDVSVDKFKELDEKIEREIDDGTGKVIQKEEEKDC